MSSIEALFDGLSVDCDVEGKGKGNCADDEKPLEVFPIEHLPETAMNNVVTFLDQSSVLSMRQVSKQMKYFGNLWFKAQTTYTANNLLSEEKLTFLCSFYSHIRKLIIECNRCTHICSTLPAQFMAKFPRVEELSIRCTRFSRDDKIFDELAVFMNIKSLEIVRYGVTDLQMSVLLPNLKNLQKLTIKSSNVLGSCFSKMGENVNKVHWRTYRSWNSNGYSFNFGEQGRNIECFCLEFARVDTEDSDTDDFTIGHFNREMPNLKRLQIRYCSDNNISVKDINKFRQLQYLELSGVQVIGVDDFIEPMYTVKELKLIIENISYADLAALISNFPNIRKLELSFRNVGFFPLDTEVIDALSNLKFLSSFTFKDKISGYLSVTEVKLLSVALRGMVSVKYFILQFGNWTNKRISVYKQLISLANEMPNTKFFVSMPLKTKLRRKQPSNLVVNFLKVPSCKRRRRPQLFDELWAVAFDNLDELL